jgi:hypothetical protein
MQDMTARLADDALRRRYEAAHPDYLTGGKRRRERRDSSRCRPAPRPP